MSELDNEPIVIEHVLNAPADKVWEAISDSDEMRKWYFDLPGFKPQPGYKFSFEGGTEDNKYLHLCEVTEAIPNEKLTYSWRYDGYAGVSFVTFELFGQDDRTRLKLCHAGLETFPNNPDFAKSNFEEGWNYMICNSLVEFFEQV